MRLVAHCLSCPTPGTLSTHLCLDHCPLFAPIMSCFLKKLEVCLWGLRQALQGMTQILLPEDCKMHCFRKNQKRVLETSGRPSEMRLRVCGLLTSQNTSKCDQRAPSGHVRRSPANWPQISLSAIFGIRESSILGIAVDAKIQLYK